MDAGSHAEAGRAAPVDAQGGTDSGTFPASSCPSGPRGQFAPMTQVGAASARIGPQLLWTGAEMLVYSLCAGDNDALYSPCTDRWRPVSSPSAPCAMVSAVAGPRVYLLNASFSSFTEIDGISGQSTALESNGMPLTWLPAAAPTSAGLIVWGGATPMNFGNDGYTGSNAGAVYDRATNRWRPMSTTGAPSERVAQAAWSGTELGVWGGYAATSVQTPAGRVDCPGYGQSNPRPQCPLLSDGALYEPGADTWTPIASTGVVPSPRIDDLLTWAGGKLLVWGGYGGDPNNAPLAFVPNGAFYDPKTQVWTAVAPLPSAAMDGSSFWTGSRLVLVQRGDLAGWIYDPATTTWTALPPVSGVSQCGVPTLSEGSLAGTCTGSDGATHAVLLRDGDTQWSQFTVPGPLIEGAGVLWTGTALIVWGGAPPQVTPTCPPGFPCDPPGPMPVNTGEIVVP
jgi:hypothetical protein